MTIKSSIDYYEPLYQNVVHDQSLGDMPRELEEAIGGGKCLDGIVEGISSERVSRDGAE